MGSRQSPSDIAARERLSEVHAEHELFDFQIGQFDHLDRPMASHREHVRLAKDVAFARNRSDRLAALGARWRGNGFPPLCNARVVLAGVGSERQVSVFDRRKRECGPGIVDYDVLHRVIHSIRTQGIVNDKPIAIAHSLERIGNAHARTLLGHCFTALIALARSWRTRQGRRALTREARARHT